MDEYKTNARESKKIMMKAVHQAGWGGREQLTLKNVRKPQGNEKDEGKMLVRVAAVSMHAGDHHMLTGRPYMIRIVVGRREIPGMDFAGVVVEDSSGSFTPGERVFGTTDMACGAFAEYVCVKRTSTARIPSGVDFATAAAVPTSAMTAMQALRVARPVAKNDRVLVHGASGGVGSFAVQLAKAAGAHVTGVCSSKNRDFVREMGADKVVDYTVGETPSGEYDRIIDLVGNRSMSTWRTLLKADGNLIAVSLPNPESEWVPVSMFRVLLSNSFFSQKRFHLFMQEVHTADLETLATMLQDGSLRPAIGQRLYGLSSIPDALSTHSLTLGLGHTVGKTVVHVHDCTDVLA